MPPHIISILQDDLGFFDSGVHNPISEQWTQNITSLAKQGVVLNYHYSHWHCSPSRRSFLTGRLPIHHGEQLSSNSGDDVDLRMNWLSEKLVSRGYEAHWFGKMHTGFRSMSHLPISHNFTKSTGSLQTGGDYSGSGHSTRWQGYHPILVDSQFADKPPGCSAASTPEQDAVVCSAKKFLPNTILPCGHALSFIKVQSPKDCCAACSALQGCSHWVFTGQTKASFDGATNCHLKEHYPKQSCEKTKQGSTSGVLSPPSPPPSGDATCTNEYSTDLWGQLALQAVQEHNVSRPLYVHLCFQAVHTPYDVAPGDPTGNVYRGMLWRADVFIGRLVNLLKTKDMYENTLIMYSSDNGGVESGNNYPLRGEKHSNWEGGMRTAAFVSGGFIPKHVQGTSNNHTMHLVDWYATFSVLAGADPTDNPPVPPNPVNHDNPWQNIYGNVSYPPVDGVNVWPLIINPSSDINPGAAHPNLVLSKQVLISGKYKLLVSQPHFKSQNSGWKNEHGVWRQPFENETHPCIAQDLPPSSNVFYPVPGTPHAMPCLFDLRNDPGEHVDLSKQFPTLVRTMWATLNETVLTQRDCQGWSYTSHGEIPGPLQMDGVSRSCSPPLLIGTCNVTCATKKWATYGRIKDDGPICDVPGC